MYQKLFTILSLFIISTNLLACSCGSMVMSVAKINNYDLVFKGKIIAKETVDSKSITQEDHLTKFSLDYFKYTFEVSEEIKPQLDTKQIIVYSITQSSACGVNYKLNDEYYIFSYENDGKNFTGLCAANMKAKEANRKFKKLLCEYKKPKGQEIWKDLNGLIVSKGKVKANVAEGEWTNFHRYGTIKSKGHYINGKKEGEWHYFADTKESEILYSQLSQAQKEEVIDPKNICNRKEWFENGKRVDHSNIFNN